MGNFNEKYMPKVKKMFPTITKNVSVQLIRTKLLEYKYSLQLLRYLPDIYYITTEIPFVIIPQNEYLSMVTRYALVVSYERQHKLRLPASKKYFAYQFILEIDAKYPDKNFKQLMVFLPKQFNNLSAYEKCYTDIFKKKPISILETVTK